MKNLIFWIFTSFVTFLMIASVSCKEKEETPTPVPNMGISIPTQGNSWFFLNPDQENVQVSDVEGAQWTNPQQVLRTYFRVERSGDLHIGIKARIDAGESALTATFGNDTEEISVSTTSYTDVYIGTYAIESPGYYYLDISGVSKESLNFADVSDVILGGSAVSTGVHYINEDYFYWGRRGPSVHLTYEVPASVGNVHYFYNEVTVPEGNDVIGSYYMANGFGEGYFGFQVNSDTERRILFSVWSPYQTDDPNEIPEDQRIKLLRKGDDVVVNDFGNEGSGGQSFLRYNWETGETYKFLLKGEPASGETNKTNYTAWFAPVESNDWMLIASWQRPLISTYLTSIYSFLENFSTRTGPLQRKAYYNNQWAMNTSGVWFELNRARFTADATARDEARLDYAGGLQSAQEGFFLQNCGFFSETTTIDSWFTRTLTGRQPEIDFDLLP